MASYYTILCTSTGHCLSHVHASGLPEMQGYMHVSNLLLLDSVRKKCSQAKTQLCHTFKMTTRYGLLPGESDRKMSARTALKKLCNHPKLIYDAMHARTAGGGDSGARGSGKSGGGGPDGFEVRVFACAAKICCRG